MNTTDYTFSFESSRTAESVFEALLDVRHWWSGLYGEEIDGESRKVGDEFTFNAGGGMHYSKQKLVELIPGKRLVWRVTESSLSFIGKKDEWTNTRFVIQLVGISRTVEFYGGLFSVSPHVSIEAVKQTDLVIIPSLNHNYEHAVEENEPMIEWLNQQYKRGAEIASICTGAFLLAKAGILDGKTCSTHWSAENVFRNMFPAVKLQTEKLITDEHGLYTNGGAYSFLNLIIYLVEKYFDRQTAIYCSKIFQIELDRQSQSPFIIFSGQKTHADEVVKKAQAYIEGNLAEKISVEQLSSKLNVGRRNFDRRFIKATGNTPLEYAQRVKVEAVKKELETSRKNVNEVMFEVGYSDPKAFREVFRKVTGMSPLEYRSRYNKEAAFTVPAEK